MLTRIGCNAVSVWIGSVGRPFHSSGTGSEFLPNIQRVQNLTEIPEKIDNALEDLSTALSSIGISEEFPRSLTEERLDEIHASAIFLIVSIMKCLSAIIKWMNRNGTLCFGRLIVS